MFYYERGQESRTVVENNDFDNSIFNNQYRRAISLIDSYLKDTHPETSRIVCFTGERGVGKTSCMMTVRSIVSPTFPYDDEEENVIVKASMDFLREVSAVDVATTDFYCPDIIDPSFFDSSHNLLEILMGSLYGSLKAEVNRTGLNTDRVKLRELQKAFEEVKRGIFNLHKESGDTYSDLTELDMLASAVNLKEKIRSLFKLFLDFTGHDVILLAVDDIDLCPHGAFEMCEQIRKYLAMPECIILLSVKYEQLEAVVASHFLNQFNPRGFQRMNYDATEMAQRYLAKLLPAGVRVTMPSVYDLCEQVLSVKVDMEYAESGAHEVHSSIRQGIPEVIFRKTRYLFYNNKRGVSLIVPNNLRQFTALLGLLYSMPDIDDGAEDRTEILRRNDSAFKHYFYHIWTDDLPMEYKCKILEWVTDTSVEALNKSVVSWLRDVFTDELKRHYGEEENGWHTPIQVKAYTSFKDEILKKGNFSYNVTIGDVFFILGLLETDTRDISKIRMLFFIRSLYSIALFESYDLDAYIVEHHMDKEVMEEETGLYRTDKRFESTYELQRLTWGSFFTFMPGELLPNDVTGIFNFDTRVINGSRKADKKYSLADLFNECKAIIATYDADVEEINSLKENTLFQTQESKKEIREKEETLAHKRDIFKLGEFFILTIGRSIGAKAIDSFYNGTDSYRSVSIPAFFSQFNVYTGYYVFNVLAPFYNLINPEYTYGRFKELAGDMFTFAKEHDFSLLSEIVAQGIKARPHIGSQNWRRKLHCMMSDVVIRNGEVLDAIRENLKSYRFDRYGEGAFAKISEIYRKIQSSGMTTHRKSHSSNDDRHNIDFKFLEPLAKFMESLNRKENHDKGEMAEIREKFYSIFDYVESRREKRNDSNKREKKDSDSEAPYILTVKAAAELFAKLSEIFGANEIGDAKTVMRELKRKFPDKISTESIAPYLKGQEKGVPFIYSATSILAYLAEWEDNEKIRNWLDLFDITL